MGAGVRDAFPPPMCCVVVFIHLRMETPLRGRSGGHAGAAPTHFVWVDCVWMSALTHFVWKVMCTNVVTQRV